MRSPASGPRAVRHVGRHLRLVARRAIVRIPVRELTDEFGFSVGPGGWNHYTALLAEHDRLPDRPVEATTYGRFFLDHRVNGVRDLNDLLDLTDGPPRFAGLPRFWLGTYPWGGLSASDIGRPGPAFGWAHDEATGDDTSELWGRGRTLWHRPCNRATLWNEWRLTVDLCASIRDRGYSPVTARGFPLVTLLHHSDGRRRAIIVDGHHRIAVLAHLGARAAVVEVGAEIGMADAARWHAVIGGHCTVEEATEFFDAFFELDGSERY